MPRNFPGLRASVLYTIGLFFMCLQASAKESAPTPTDRAVPVASTVHISTVNSHRQIQQQTTLTGVVVDTAGRAIEGATIAIKGTRTQVMTDAEGRFSLQTAASSGILIITHIGHQTVEQRFGADNLGPYRFVLLPSDHALEEVEINAGYYTVKDRERTGSISRITAEEIARQPVTNPMAAMIGRMPGVDVVQTNGAPGGGFTIQIRGRNSLRSNGNDPLFIIDGVPVPAEQKSSLLINTIRPNGGPFSTLNPADIESIEVLKDADATAIYGSRGANGVVLVTTKKGSAGNPVSRLSLSHGIGQVGAAIALLDTEQYLEMRREAFANDGRQPGLADYDVNGTWDETRYTDWQKELMGGTAHLSNTRYSLSGGEGRTRFLISAGYSRETSVMPTTGIDNKLNASMNIQHHSADQRFTVQLFANYSVNNNDLPRVSPFRDAMSLPPNAPKLYDEEGNLNWENGSWNNPMAGFRQRYEGRIGALVSNAMVSYILFKGLAIKTSLGYNELGNKENLKIPRAALSPYNNTAASANFSDGISTTWIAEPQITYLHEKRFGKLSLLAGTSFQETYSQAKALSVNGFASDALLGNPQAGATMNITSVSDVQYRYHALFGRVNYNMLDRYIINLTGRRDGSSRFGPGRQFANFGAIGATWLFGDEPAVKRTLGFLSHGKLRTSYGITGSDQIGNYGFYDVWNTAPYSYDGMTPLRPARLFNPDFGWEENRKLEFGLEMGLWKDRFQLSASYFRNRSGNQLISYALPTMTGFSSILLNFPATVQNTGMELSLSSINISGQHFHWTSDINLTIPGSKLLSFQDIETSSYRSSYVVGKSMDIEFAYHSLGVDPMTGLYVFIDVDDDGRYTTDGDYQTRKKRNKHYSGGFNNSISYRGIDLNILVQFVKQTGLNYRSVFNTAPGRMANQPIYVLDRWQQEGDQANVQRFTSGTGDANTRFGLNGDNRIVDASFVRIKNVALSYRLPIKSNGTSSTFSLSGQNLALFTNYQGLDPENARSASVSIPPLRMVSLGYELTF